jgi:ankyrin repeat protein
LDKEGQQERRNVLDKMYDMTWFNAVASFDYEKMKTMIDNGQDVNVVKQYTSIYTIRGDTALIHHARKGKEIYNHILKITDLLIDNSSTDVNMKDLAHSNTPLMAAIIFNRPYMFDKLLSRSDIDVNASDLYNETALMKAVSIGSSSTVRKLLEHNDINVNIANEDGMTALDKALCGIENMRALSLDYANIIAMLKEHGAKANVKESIVEGIFNPPSITDLDIRMKNSNVKSDLTWSEAIFKGDYKAVWKHIANGQDVNERVGPDRLPSIMAASMYENDAIIDLLLSVPGLDINAMDRNDNTVLVYAIMGNTRTLEHILNMPGIDLYRRNAWGRTVFDIAERSSQVPVENRELLREYKDNEKNINPNDDEYFYLHGHHENENTNEHVPNSNLLLKEAFENHDEKLIRQLIPECNVQLVEKLIDKYYVINESIFVPLTDAEVNSRMKEYVPEMTSDLWWKSISNENNNAVLVKSFIDRGWDVNTKLGSHHWPSIVIACISGSKNVISLLLKSHDLDINATDDDGNTAIMFSIYRNDEILKMLLEHPDIDLTIKNNLGKTVIDKAEKVFADGNSFEKKRALMILNHAVKLDESIFVPPTETELDKRTEHYKLDPRETWQSVIRYDNVAGIRKYLSIGIDVNQKIGGREEPPLLFAVSLPSDNAFNFLVRQPKLNINARDAYGNTALMFALWNQNDTFVKKILERPNVDVINGNAYGESPLTIVGLEKFHKYKDMILKYKETHDKYS